MLLLTALFVVALIGIPLAIIIGRLSKGSVPHREIILERTTKDPSAETIAHTEEVHTAKVTKVTHNETEASALSLSTQSMWRILGFAVVLALVLLYFGATSLDAPTSWSVSGSLLSWGVLGLLLLTLVLILPSASIWYYIKIGAVVLLSLHIVSFAFLEAPRTFLASILQPSEVQVAAPPAGEVTTPPETTQLPPSHEGGSTVTVPSPPSFDWESGLVKLQEWTVVLLGVLLLLAALILIFRAVAGGWWLVGVAILLLFFAPFLQPFFTNIGDGRMEATMPEFARAPDGLPIVDGGIFHVGNGEDVFLYVKGRVGLSFDTYQYLETWCGDATLDYSDAETLGIVWVTSPPGEMTRIRTMSHSS